MANPDLVRTLDFILTRCNERDIEAVAEAVVRRRRQLTLFGEAQRVPDPQRMARELSSQMNIGASIDGLKQTIMDMAVRIIKQEAPELNEDQIAELTAAWIPGGNSNSIEGPGSDLPPAVLSSMVDQFVNFSLGKMGKEEDRGLRKEMGAWPERYWKAFPGVVRLVITDYLKGEISEKEYFSKLTTALSL
jgi:hypothetical protein